MENNLIEKAAKILTQGGLIGLPTETVYGLAADARNETALKKIFTAKGRPSDHPLIIHIGSINEVNDWAKEVSTDAKKLMTHFWPGPLTLILKKQDQVLEIITAGQDSVGLRMPNHPLALSLLKQFGHGVAAPSANQFGHLSPTCAEDVSEELSNKVDLILPGGQTEIGIESTIIDARTHPFVILRQGAITKSTLEHVLNQKVLLKEQTDSNLKVSGNLLNHYAPRTPLLLLSTSELKNLDQEIQNQAIFIIHSNLSLPKQCKVVTLPNDAKSYAQEIYKSLRQADRQKAKWIIVEKPPKGEFWDAILDRLQKAAKKIAL